MIYDLTNVQFRKMLTNMFGLFDKAAQNAELKKYDVNVLLTTRLAPDQFHFTKQIQILCDTAKKCASQLTGKEPPAQAEGDASLGDLRARMEGVIGYLASLSKADYANAATVRVSQPRWEGQYLTGEEYVLQHAVPNFYFHFTTAYSILRASGVDIGKRDYLGAMPYKR